MKNTKHWFVSFYCDSFRSVPFRFVLWQYYRRADSIRISCVNKRRRNKKRQTIIIIIVITTNDTTETATPTPSSRRLKEKYERKQWHTNNAMWQQQQRCVIPKMLPEVALHEFVVVSLSWRCIFRILKHHMAAFGYTEWMKQKQNKKQLDSITPLPFG